MNPRNVNQLTLWVGALTLLITVLTPVSGAAAKSSTSKTWELIWQDEFESSSLDLANWNIQLMPDPHNNEL